MKDGRKKTKYARFRNEWLGLNARYSMRSLQIKLSRSSWKNIHKAKRHASRLYSAIISNLRKMRLQSAQQ